MEFIKQYRTMAACQKLFKYDAVYEAVIDLVTSRLNKASGLEK